MEKSFETANRAWNSIVSILACPSRTDLELVDKRMQQVEPNIVAAVQFILIGSGWSCENLSATGTYDRTEDLPSINQLYGAMGGSGEIQ